MNAASSGPQPDDVHALENERDRLRLRVQELEARPRQRGRARHVVAAILVVLAVLSFTAAVPGLWARRTLLDTDRYVAMVGPLAQEPPVQDYIARNVTTAVFDALSVEDRLGDALTDRAPRIAFLAGPITNGVRGFVQDRVEGIVSSNAFASYWTEVNRFVHAQVVAAVGGEGGQLVTEDGKVVLNLVPIVNEALQRISGLVSQLIGRDVTLPKVTPEEIPSEVIPRLESALGVDLPDRFGTIVIYDGDEIAAVQRAVSAFGRGLILVVLAFVVFAVVAIWLSPAKRRTMLQVSGALLVVLVIERRLAVVAADRVVGQARPENGDAARAVVNAVLGTLLAYTGWLLAITAIVLVVAAVTGPYPWAVRLRRSVGGMGQALAGTFREGRSPREAAWVAAHRGALLVAGAVIGLLILLVTDLSLLSTLVVAGMIGAFELLVVRLSAASGELGSAPVQGKIRS
jgi:hypothetical protein